MDLQALRKLKIPAAPGVYLFKKGKEILYVGKATVLKTRVRSYFAARLFLTRGLAIEKMVAEANALEWSVTDSVLEALILEAKLIKKYQPAANALQKDDKSFFYVTITKEPFPRVLLERGHGQYGPFTSAGSIREALRIIRKIFPYNTHPQQSLRGCNRPRQPRKDQDWIASHGLAMTRERGCFEYQISLCPGTCVGAISRLDYAKTVKKIKLIFEGKKGQVLSALKKEMQKASTALDFETAARLKHQIASLEHIRDVSLIKNDSERDKNGSFRIEGYDIAHHAGGATVGVMTLVENGEPAKHWYRKFKIKSTTTGTVDDIKHLSEVLRRRLGHLEWPLPQLIVVDGSLPHKHAAESLLSEKGFAIPVAAVVKDERHKPREIIADGDLARKFSKEILLVNAEAHRFAITYHRTKSRKNLLRHSVSK